MIAPDFSCLLFAIVSPIKMQSPLKQEILQALFIDVFRETGLVPGTE